MCKMGLTGLHVLCTSSVQPGWLIQVQFVVSRLQFFLRDCHSFTLRKLFTCTETSVSCISLIVLIYLRFPIFFFFKNSERRGNRQKAYHYKKKAHLRVLFASSFSLLRSPYSPHSLVVSCSRALWNACYESY